MMGESGDKAQGAAEALELFHAAALVHDDIEDNASTRRNLPTLHAQVGVAIGLGNDAAIERLRHVGITFGIAFQVKDDLLDYPGYSPHTGKDRLRDLREGKRTVVLAHALATSPQADELKRLVCAERRDEGDVDRCRRMIEDAGSLDFAAL